MTLRFGLLLLLAAPTLAAQSGSASPRFEVASVRKLSNDPANAKLASTSRYSIDNGRVRFTAVNVATLIRYAWHIKAYQLDLAGNTEALDPDSQVLYTVEGTFPHGATADQAPEMMRSLLSERFGLVLETATKQLDSYTLIAGKAGAKLEPASAAPDWELPAFTAPKVTFGAGGAMTMISGGLLITTPPGKPQSVEATTLDDLTDFLSLKMMAPVLNRTGLAGRYKIALEIQPPDLASLMGTSGSRPDPAALMDATNAPLFTALERIGLKLQKGRNPVEVLAVRHINSSPTEN